MLLVPSELSKPLPISRSVIGQKARFPRFSSSSFSSFFHLSSSSQAIPVLSKPLQLVSSQFFSAWVKDVQLCTVADLRGQRRKKTFSADEFHGCDAIKNIAHVIRMNTFKHGSNAMQVNASD